MFIFQKPDEFLKLCRLSAVWMSVTLLLVLVGACGKAGDRANYSTSNTNQQPMNTTNAMSNTVTNTSANTQQRNENTGPHAGSTLDPDMLSDALKERLRHDNEHLMSPDKWESDAWLDVNVGAFYKNDDETAKLIVCDITDKLLRPLNKKLKPFAKQKLYDGISGNTKCRNAVNLMFRATLNSTTIHPVP